jgi:hypothetical protein
MISAAHHYPLRHTMIVMYLTTRPKNLKTWKHNELDKKVGFVKYTADWETIIFRGEKNEIQGER